MLIEELLRAVCVYVCVCVCVCVCSVAQSLSRVQSFATPWTI